MSIEMVLGGIGSGLGIANFVYWAWWAKRDKVAIVNHRVYAEFLPKGTRETALYGQIITFSNAVLSMEISCELVLTHGEKELEVKEVEVILYEKACKSLRKYFHLPLRNRLSLQHIYAYEGKALPQPILLAPKKTVRFKGKIPLDCTEEFEVKYEKTESGSYPEFIQPLLDELETKYQICWTRYDGKELSWRFPQKWWRNLGKRLWG